MLLALLLAVLAPALCVLWFMSAAMRNERLAVQQDLMTVYVNHLHTVQRQLTTYCKDKQLAAQALAGLPPSAWFAAMVRSNIADSAVLYDTNGAVLYPAPVALSATGQSDEAAAWIAARDLEFQKFDYSAAAAVYGRIAGEMTDPNLKVRALQSQASCLIKAGRAGESVGLLKDLVSRDEFRYSIGAQGTLAVPNAQLLLLKLVNDRADPVFERTSRELVARLEDYTDSRLSAGQRRFLMEEMERMTGHRFDTLRAEQLASEYIERSPNLPAQSVVQPAAMAGVYRLATANRAAVLLLRESEFMAELNALIREIALPEVVIRLVKPQERYRHAGMVPMQDAGELLANWKIVLNFRGADPFEAASERQVRIYLWSGALVISFIGFLALIAARFFSAQMRLTQLKNDLVSAVSHELKTPLASMRVLVETLIARRYRSSEQLEQYLQLIAKENYRLSHLIENFLSFSRMEQNRQKFYFDDTEPGGVVRDAVDAMHDRFGSDRCKLSVEVAETLPMVRADKEALTTVLINLLDNAYKYSGEEKEITVRAFRDNGSVTFEVTDNGIGLSARDAKRVFERFYQVDQSSTRRAGGCGLGLSIVQFIVRAHGGTVSVESELGKGSAFVVRIPLEKAT